MNPIFDINEQYLAQFYAAGEEMAATVNNYHRDVYEQSCINAAADAEHAGTAPPVFTPTLKVGVVPNCFPAIQMASLAEPVSTKQPSDYLTRRVDTGGVGDGIGSLIPNTTRSYYDRTNVTHEPGEMKQVGNRKFVYRRWNMMGGSWEEVSK